MAEPRVLGRKLRAAARRCVAVRFEDALGRFPFGLAGGALSGKDGGQATTAPADLAAAMRADILRPVGPEGERGPECHPPQSKARGTAGRSGGRERRGRDGSRERRRMDMAARHVRREFRDPVRGLGRCRRRSSVAGRGPPRPHAELRTGARRSRNRAWIMRPAAPSDRGRGVDPGAEAGLESVADADPPAWTGAAVAGKRCR